VLKMKLTALHILDKYSTTEPQPEWRFHFKTVSCCVAPAGLELTILLPNAGILDVCHHTQCQKETIKFQPQLKFC
jgi:hypothetical protein